MVVGAIPTPAPKCNETVPLGTMSSVVNGAHSNHPQFTYSSGGCEIKTIHRLAVGGYMTKEKFMHLLWYIFVYSPLTFMTGINIIILANEKIIGGNFQVISFKKKKQEIDKEKFAKFMKRVCK